MSVNEQQYTADDLRKAVRATEVAAGIERGRFGFTRAAWKYIQANVPAGFRWPVYLLVTSEHAETEEWLGGNNG